MKAREIRQLPDDEILTEVHKRREEIFRQRLRAGSDDVENPGALRQRRREIARLLTILRERQIQREKEKQQQEQQQQERERGND